MFRAPGPGEVTGSRRPLLALLARQPAFIKVILAPMAGLATGMELMNVQRRRFLGIVRALAELQSRADPAGVTARLLIEGAVLHVQADLDWLERCQDELL